MLRVANGCTVRQFPLVPWAVLMCSYDVIGTRIYERSRPQTCGISYSSMAAKKPPLRHFISGVLGLNGLELASQRGAQTGHGRQDQSGF
jgi:hypothetical protein